MALKKESSFATNLQVFYILNGLFFFRAPNFFSRYGTPHVLAVHIHEFNPDCGFMLNEKRITGRANYHIKAKNKPKTKKQIFSQFFNDELLSAFCQSMKVKL